MEILEGLKYETSGRTEAKQRETLITEYDGKSFCGFPLFFSRRLFPFLPAGFVHFVNGEPRTGRLVLFALLVAAAVAAVASVSRVTAAAGRRLRRRVDSATAPTTATATSASVAFTFAPLCWNKYT